MRMNTEIEVKCPQCKDQFPTTSTLGAMEVCTICEDVFIIEESDIVPKQ